VPRFIPKNPYVVLHSCGTLVRQRPGFPSYFPPPDARPRGTGWNGRGRQVTAEAVGRAFVHVTSDDRCQWGCGGTRGEAVVRPVNRRHCLHRFESCPCHNRSELRKRSRWAGDHAGLKGRLSLRFPSARRRADTGRTCLAPLGRISPWSTGPLAGRGRFSNSASSSSPGHPPPGRAPAHFRWQQPIRSASGVPYFAFRAPHVLAGRRPGQPRRIVSAAALAGSPTGTTPAGGRGDPGRGRRKCGGAAGRSGRGPGRDRWPTSCPTSTGSVGTPGSRW
jgi:hypothetical protein